jgi:hypothetical protein
MSKSFRPSTILRRSFLAVFLLTLTGSLTLQAAPALAAEDSTALEVQLTADKHGTIDRATGEVTVTGTIVCSRPANAFVTASATQVKGGQEAFAGWGYNLDCSPSPTGWTATFSSITPVSFTPGTADLANYAYVYNYEEETLVTGNASRQITLKKS